MKDENMGTCDICGKESDFCYLPDLGGGRIKNLCSDCMAKRIDLSDLDYKVRYGEGGEIEAIGLPPEFHKRIDAVFESM